MDTSILRHLLGVLGSRTGTTTMTAQTPVKVVDTFLKAWNNRDLAGMSTSVAPQVSGRNPLSSSETEMSKDAVCDAIERMMSAFPDLHMRIDTMVADGATVAVEEFETATLARTGTS